MPLIIVRNDITKMKVDAIVNAANKSLLGGGGVDGAIHRAAGPRLLEECRRLGGCETGEAKITRGYELTAKFVIHAVGPIWRGGFFGEKEKLASCYRNSLKIAEENGLESIAFPLISSGVYGYPKEKALRVAEDTIRDYLAKTEADMTVYLVIFDRAALDIGKKRFKEIEEFIGDRYAKAHGDSASYFAKRRESLNRPEYSYSMDNALLDTAYREDECRDEEASASIAPNAEAAFDSAGAAPTPAKPKASANAKPSGAAPSISNIGRTIDELLDESFSDMLLRKIDECGMTDSECYKKANIDRKLFSKIRSDRLYKPSKPTVIAFAIALELSLDETSNMLMKAGFALSHSNKFDLIIEYFIKHGVYDVFEINEALFVFDQQLLGA
ncbi:MAG: O-acetyl-ADP-ribose deacetylase [Clostridia bacterium]|nr:O-acetyl-ADP-ribose deacetylase [Clostridia bacterium]